MRRATDAARAELNATMEAAFRKVIAGAPRVAMTDIAPLVRRPIAVDPDGSYPELGVRSFGKGTFRKASLSGIEVGNKRLFEIHEGDLLFNIVFAWEGAIALASAADHGRVGSHRFLTCVPDPRRATSHFLLYYFLTPEGTQPMIATQIFSGSWRRCAKRAPSVRSTFARRRILRTGSLSSPFWCKS
jgi:type I restriction enzyme S subunit